MTNQYWDREYKYEWDVLYQKCTKCWEWGTIKDFPKDKNKRFWIRSDCKKCHSSSIKISHRKWYQENKSRAKESMKNYHIKHKDNINDRVRMYVKSQTDKLWFNRYYFHSRTRVFVSKYWLKPSACPMCWSTENIEIHHPNYDSVERWCDVVFCCKKCHSDIHNWFVECPKPINLKELRESNSPNRSAESLIIERL